MRIPFVDRGVETRRLLELLGRGSYLPVFLYGPEGCGKTRLLRELVERLRGRDDTIVVYVDALVKSGSRLGLRDALLGSSHVVDALLDVAARVLREAGGVPGALLASLIPFIHRVIGSRVEGKQVLIVVDEVVAGLGLGSVEAYAKELSNLVERLYEAGARSVTVVAATSEGLSRNLLGRHTYLEIACIWNLERRYAEELAQILGALDPAKVWAFTGGNPRLIIQASQLDWRLEKLPKLIFERVAQQLIHVARTHRRELAQAIDDPDTLLDNHGLAEKLIELNMVMPMCVESWLGERPRKNPEIGVGEYYSWHTPAHMLAAKHALEKT